MRATLLQSNLQNPVLTQGLVELSKKLGFSVLSVPMEYSSDERAIAWTTANGIYLNYDYAHKHPRDVPCLIAHEIMHHVIKMDASEFSLDNLNRALDYKINQFLYEHLGYDARKVHAQGLLNPRYFKLSVVEILQVLAKRGDSGPPPTSYGYESTHPLIAKCAEHIKRKFAKQLQGLVTEDYFAMDLEDLAKYHAIDFASKQVEISLPLKDYDRVFRGIWAHVTLPRAAAPLVLEDLDREDALVYCINGQQLRDAVNHDPVLGAVSAKNVLKSLAQDKQNQEAYIRKLEDRIFRARLGIGSWKRKKKAEQTLAVSTLKKRLKAAKREITINAFFETNPVVRLRARPAPSAATASLRASTSDKLKKNDYEKSVKIPGYDRSDPYATRIRLVSTRIARNLAKSKQVSDGLNDLFPGTESDTSELSGISDPQKSRPRGEGDPRQGKEAGKGKGKEEFTRYELITANLTLLRNIMLYVKLFQTALQSSNPTQPNEDSFGQYMMLQYGNDLGNVVPSELALLADPATQLEFYVKLANRSLLTYVPPNRKRYPVVISIDGSGSMKGIYPKVVGFALAMASLLIKDGRGVAIQLFDNRVGEPFIFTPKASVDLNALLKVVCRPSYGGTDFDASILGAYAIKERMQWPHFNLIMVTDGYCQVLKQREILLRKTDRDRLSVATTASVPQSSVFDDLFKLNIKKSIADLISVGKTIL